MAYYPERYLVHFQQGGIKCLAREEYYGSIRRGMREGDPRVDIIDLDGENCVVNCQFTTFMYLSTPEGRAKHSELHNEEEDTSEQWKRG